MNLGFYPPYTGFHTRDEAPGAMRNGTRVGKINSTPQDSHQDGALATILGSMRHPEHGIAYFVEWDSHPLHAVLIVANRVIQH
jgi:hypothetical protein